MDRASIIASSEATEVLELVKASLDAVAMFVDGGIMRDRDLAGPVGRDHSVGAHTASLSVIFGAANHWGVIAPVTAIPG